MTAPQRVNGEGVSKEPKRVDGWKDIASHLRRGVRTVQRWEREEGLPVHRLQHEKLGSVYAYTQELDGWWEKRGSALEPAGAPAVGRSLAVLPFRDMSQEQDQGYFCEGMAEELVLALSRLKGLQVAARGTSFRYPHGAADPWEMGRLLRVSTLLEGSVRKHGALMRVSVRLIDTATGFQLWSEVYNRQTGDVFAIQEEIARSVAQALEVTLSAGEQQALGQSGTHNAEAYDFYLRGRTRYYGYSADDVRAAIGLYTRAAEMDAGYAAAWAGLADCWSFLYLYADRCAETLGRAEEASRRAVELEEDSARAQASRALVLSLKGEDEAAEEAFGRALGLDANQFEAQYYAARHAFGQGRLEVAVERYEAAMRLNPDDYQAPLLVAQIYDDLGVAEKAREARRRGIALAERRLERQPEDARALYMAANGMAALGEKEQGRQWAARARALRPKDAMLLYNLACIYGLLGDRTEALDALEAAVENGLRQRAWLEHDSNLDGLRGEARFAALVQRL